MLRKFISILLCFSIAFGDTAVVYPQFSSSLSTSNYDETLQVLEDMWQRSNDYYNNLLEDMYRRSIEVDPSDLSRLESSLNSMRSHIDELRSLYQQADPQLRSALYRVYPDLLSDIRTITTTTVNIHSSAYNPVPFPYGYARTVATTDGFNALLGRLFSSLPSLVAYVPYFLFNVLLDFGYVNLGEGQLYHLYLVRKLYRTSVAPQLEPYLLPFIYDLPIPDFIPDYFPTSSPITSGCYQFFFSGGYLTNPMGNFALCRDEIRSDLTREFYQQVYDIYRSFAGCGVYSEPLSIAGSGVAQYYHLLTEYILRCSYLYYCKGYYMSPDANQRWLSEWFQITAIWDNYYSELTQQLLPDLGFTVGELALHLREFREFQGVCSTYGSKEELFDTYLSYCRSNPSSCVFSNGRITHVYVYLLFYTPPYSVFLIYHPVVVRGTGCGVYTYDLCSFGIQRLLVDPHEYAYRWCYGHTASSNWVRVPIPVDCDIDWETFPDIPPELEPYISPLLNPDFHTDINPYPRILEAYRELLRRLARMRKRLRQHEPVRVQPSFPRSFPEVPLVSPVSLPSPDNISYTVGEDTIVIDLTSLEPYILGRLKEEAQQSRDIVVSLPSPPRCEEVEERFSLSLRELIDLFRYSFIAFAILFGVLSGAVGSFSIYLFIRSLSLWRL